MTPTSSVVNEIMAAFHATMILFQLWALWVCILIRRCYVERCQDCDSCTNKTAIRAWTLLCVAVGLMMCRRVTTALIWSKAIAFYPWKYLAWVALPLTITILIVVAFHNILLCELSRRRKEETNRWLRQLSS